jgi:sarcosine oxidase subunit alpha
MTGWRHPDLGRVDRGTTLRFRFDGRDFSGFQGDTLASALLASGERLLGRSFKYHRPRGLWGMGGEEPNAIFDVTHQGRTIPNQRATTVALRDGMVARSVNTAPDARRDRLALIDLAHKFLPAGFYYKTFMAMGWMRWEPMIRRMAGLGRLDPETHPPADSAHLTANCDVLVIGAGPAGLAAAKAAAARGAAVFLVDEAAETGGALRWRGGQIDGGDWSEFTRSAEDAVRASGGRVMANTTLWGAFDHGMFAAWERRTDAPDRHWHIRAHEVILAAGAIERPLWFANNDLPGIMSAEAALHYLVLHGAVAGRKILLGTANDATYPVAEVLAQAGCRVTLCDARAATPPAPDGVELIDGARITKAHGKRAVGAATVDGAFIDADTILVSGGYTPSVHLFMQAGGKLDWDDKTDALIPRSGTAPMIVAGAANGAFGLAEALAQGHAAGGGTGAAPRAASVNWSLAPMRPDPMLKGRQWIDPQNDVTLKDVKLAAQEGFRSVEHLKRYTTLGMATDQGRSANFAALATMAVLTGQSIPETGTTTYRPPFAPVPLSVIGGMRRGRLFNPPKRLALEAAHLGAGAVLREYGGWLRPAWYGGDEHSTVQAEALTARATVGIYDASPLGKIEVIGPQAGALLDFCGYMRMSTLAPGRARYGFMLSETGVIHDDGVVLRLDENRFILSASSSHVASARMILEEARQDRFDPRQVFVHDTTQNWVTLSVTGPRAGDLLRGAGLPEAFCDDARLSHMGVMETQWGEVPLRIARISFTGDRSYELSVPARHGATLRTALDQSLNAVGGSWIGLEAVMILRAEKGYILVGKDTDGVTMPQDLGWSGPRDKRQDEYFGHRSLFTPEACRTDRRQLVGLHADGPEPLPVGAHVIAQGGPRRSCGFVTSSHFSPCLSRPIALAMVEGGLDLMGREIDVFHLGATRRARIVPACAFDPEGDRLND